MVFIIFNKDKESELPAEFEDFVTDHNLSIPD